MLVRGREVYRGRDGIGVAAVVERGRVEYSGTVVRGREVYRGTVAVVRGVVAGREVYRGTVAVVVPGKIGVVAGRVVYNGTDEEAVNAGREVYRGTLAVVVGRAVDETDEVPLRPPV